MNEIALINQTTGIINNIITIYRNSLTIRAEEKAKLKQRIEMIETMAKSNALFIITQQHIQMLNEIDKLLDGLQFKHKFIEEIAFTRVVHLSKGLELYFERFL